MASLSTYSSISYYPDLSVTNQNRLQNITYCCYDNYLQVVLSVTGTALGSSSVRDRACHASSSVRDHACPARSFIRGRACPASSLYVTVTALPVVCP